MGSLLIVSGPPGAGKSTVSALVAHTFERSMLVIGDDFYGFIAAGGIDPWLPESNAQNEVVASAAALATARFALDYDVVYDGVLGLWHLETFMRAGAIDALDYAVLLPPVEVTLERVATRLGHEFSNEQATRHMHDEFASAGTNPRHVFTDVVDDPVDMVEQIQARRERGELRVVTST